MGSHALLTLYRSLSRHLLYAALNILGLAVGVAVFLTLFLYVRFEAGYDRWIPHAETIYRVDNKWTLPGRPVVETASVTGLVLPFLQTDYPQIAAGVRIMNDSKPVIVGGVAVNQDMAFVDPSFFDVFAFPLIAGDPRSALARPDNMVVSETEARKYFGAANPLGQTLTVMLDGKPQLYRVSAVLKDLPANTHIQIGMLAPLTPAMQQSHTAFQKWGSASSSTYVRFRRPGDAAAVQANLTAFVNRHAAGTSDGQLGTAPSRAFALILRALPSLHFGDIEVQNTQRAGVDPRLIVSLSLVGGLSLLMAALNYINLATARAALRAKEVALRKAMGASRAALIVQFMAEAAAVVALATLIGCALVEIMLPLVNTLGGGDLHLHYLGPDGILPLVVALVIGVSLISGFYPAVILSGYRPAAVLASAKSPGGGRAETRVRAILVVLQFSAAIAFAISTVIISAQAEFMRSADRGFHREGLIVIESLGASELEDRQTTALDLFRTAPGVVAVTISSAEPASPNSNFSNFGRPGLKGDEPSLRWETVGRNFFETYGAEIVAGRAFDAAHALDDSAGLKDEQIAARGLNVMLNESAVKTLQFKNPADAIGKPVYVIFGHKRFEATVIGIAHDIRFQSPREPVASTLYFYDSRKMDNAVAAIRYRGVSDAEMLARLHRLWQGFAPTVPFEAKTADVKLSDYYIPDEQRARLFTLGAALAIGIGCIGLYGMAAFTAARRTREIGVRKALGATTQDIARLLMRQTLQPVLIANLAAWPVAYFGMRAWLAGFDQRIELNVLYFLVPALGALMIAVFTVLSQVLRLARVAPATALRDQ